MSATESYRGYFIYPAEYAVPDSRFQYVHKDYDGPEDNRFGYGATVEECKAEIDDLEDVTRGEAA
jgi:hypothetical protein